MSGARYAAPCMRISGNCDAWEGHGLRLVSLPFFCACDGRRQHPIEGCSRRQTPWSRRPTRHVANVYRCVRVGAIYKFYRLGWGRTLTGVVPCGGWLCGLSMAVWWCVSINFIVRYLDLFLTLLLICGIVALATPTNQGDNDMAYEEVEPICDICGVMQYSDESLEWNGDTGNHVHCEEASHGKTM